MWDPPLLPVQQKVPQIKIVFDLFHGVGRFNCFIDKVQNTECHKDIFKGTKYLLLKNRPMSDGTKTENISSSFQN
jgi:hypothetical protein